MAAIKKKNKDAANEMSKAGAYTRSLFSST